MKRVIITLVLYVALMIVVASFLTGCSSKQDIIYKPVKFDMQKIDMKGVYIDMGTKEMQRLCSPKMVELNDAWTGVQYFYDDQIDRYNTEKDKVKTKDK